MEHNGVIKLGARVSLRGIAEELSKEINKLGIVKTKVKKAKLIIDNQGTEISTWCVKFIGAHYKSGEWEDEIGIVNEHYWIWDKWGKWSPYMWGESKTDYLGKVDNIIKKKAKKYDATVKVWLADSSDLALLWTPDGKEKEVWL